MGKKDKASEDELYHVGEPHFCRITVLHCEHNPEVITKARVTTVSDDEDDEKDDRTKKKRKKKNTAKAARWVCLPPSFYLSLAEMLC